MQGANARDEREEEGSEVWRLIGPPFQRLAWRATVGLLTGWGRLASFVVAQHLKPNTHFGFAQRPGGFTQNPLKFLGKGLDVSREAGILTNGSAVDRGICRGVTVGSKKVFPA
jgi:hypothetical protein